MPVWRCPCQAAGRFARNCIIDFLHQSADIGNHLEGNPE